MGRNLGATILPSRVQEKGVNWIGRGTTLALALEARELLVRGFLTSLVSSLLLRMWEEKDEGKG